RLRSTGDVYRAANDDSTGRDVLFQHRLYAMFVLRRCAGSGAPFGRVRGLRFPPADEMGVGALPASGGLRQFLRAAVSNLPGDQGVDDSFAISNVSGIDLVRISGRVRSTGSADCGRVVDGWLDVDLGKRRTLKPKNLAD